MKITTHHMLWILLEFTEDPNDIEVASTELLAAVKSSFWDDGRSSLVFDSLSAEDQSISFRKIESPVYLNTPPKRCGIYGILSRDSVFEIAGGLNEPDPIEVVCHAEPKIGGMTLISHLENSDGVPLLIKKLSSGLRADFFMLFDSDGQLIHKETHPNWMGQIC